MKRNLMIMFAALFAFASFGNGPQVEAVQYRVTLKTAWTSLALPVDFPSNAHFSPLVVASHGAAYSLYQKGSLATPGLESVAETGATQNIRTELSAQQNLERVRDFAVGSGIARGEGMSSVVVELSQQHPLISAVSMIAPSPDWIVGVNGVNLLRDGQFVEELTVPVFAVDAGTDSGQSFRSADRDTNPKEGIRLLNEGVLFVQEHRLVPFGEIVIEKL